MSSVFDSRIASISVHSNIFCRGKEAKTIGKKEVMNHQEQTSCGLCHR